MLVQKLLESMSLTFNKKQKMCALTFTLREQNKVHVVVSNMSTEGLDVLRRF